MCPDVSKKNTTFLFAMLFLQQEEQKHWDLPVDLATKHGLASFS